MVEIYNSNKSIFLAVYRRRRIGKTYLVTNFFNEKGLFFHITGTPLNQQNSNYGIFHVFIQIRLTLMKSL